MERVFTPAGGIVFLVLFGLAMILITWLATRKHRTSRREFLVAGRDIGVGQGAMSIAASWIWAPALFVAAQKAFDQGLAGLFWFTAPNFLCLLVFAPLALRVRRARPDGFTLPEFIRQQHGPGVHVLYLIQFLGLQVCCFAVQILAGATLIEQLTGVHSTVVAASLVVIALTYSLMGGVRASIVTDVVQMILIFGVIAATVPWAVSEAGGLSAVVDGFGGRTGQLGNIFDPWVAYSFGIPVTISLMSGPIGDQQHWQRAYALRSDRIVWKTFLVGSILFVIVPLSLSLLGFVAANPEVADTWKITDSQLVGMMTVSNLLPQIMVVAFGVMLLSGLCSTLDSVLCAGSALAAVDLPAALGKPGHGDAGGSSVRAARLAMLVLAALGLLIALIPGLKVLHLFLFYGIFRASTMIPTIFTVLVATSKSSVGLGRHLSSRAVFWAVLLSLLFGAPVYALGAVFENPHLSVAGSLLVVVIGLVVCKHGTSTTSE